MQRNKQLHVPIKSYQEGSNGFLLTFVGSATTSSQDRDGDILKSGGAVLDPRCPLLWAHDATKPIGKVLGKVSHTNDKLDVRCGILDYGDSSGDLATLARDVAVLVKNNVVALSIGFDPTEYELMDSDKGRYEISRYEILELSAVAVPSNRGALIQMVDSGKCHSLAMKSFCASCRSEDAADEEFELMFSPHAEVLKHREAARFDAWVQMWRDEERVDEELAGLLIVDDFLELH